MVKQLQCFLSHFSWPGTISACVVHLRRLWLAARRGGWENGMWPLSTAMTTCVPMCRTIFVFTLCRSWFQSLSWQGMTWRRVVQWSCYFSCWKILGMDGCEIFPYLTIDSCLICLVYYEKQAPWTPYFRTFLKDDNLASLAIVVVSISLLHLHTVLSQQFNLQLNSPWNQIFCSTITSPAL